MLCRHARRARAAGRRPRRIRLPRHRTEAALLKYVVTGGAGFIGSHIADALLAEGHEVHVIDDLSLGKLANVPKGAAFHAGSILDDELLSRVIEGASVVFHQAALPSVPRSIADPFTSNWVNVDGTLKVLIHARDKGVEKVVFAASSSAYGDTVTLPKHEDMPPQPKSPYAITKLVGEMYCRVFYEVYGLRTTALRYFNVYGPRQDPLGAYAAVIPRFLSAALAGAPLTIHGDGMQSRDFTFVQDVARANLLAARTRGSDGQVINVGAGGRTTVNDLAQMVLDITGSRSRVERVAPRRGDVAHSLASLERSRKLLGFDPRVPLRDGLAACVRAMDPGRTIA